MGFNQVAEKMIGEGIGLRSLGSEEFLPGPVS